MESEPVFYIPELNIKSEAPKRKNWINVPDLQCRDYKSASWTNCSNLMAFGFVCLVFSNSDKH